MNKVFNLLTICKKAGKLVLGMDSVKQSCDDLSAKCVIVTNDISEKSLKEVKFFCSNKEIPVLTVDSNMNEMWSTIGRKCAVLGVCDDGFSKKFQSIILLQNK